MSPDQDLKSQSCNFPLGTPALINYDVINYDLINYYTIYKN